MKLQIYKHPKLIDVFTVANNLRADEREQYEAFSGETYDPEVFAHRYSYRTHLSWFLAEDEHPIAVAGFDLVRPGVYQDWMLTTDRAWDPDVWRTTTKAVKRVMDAMLKTDAHRLQCVSLASRIHAHKWYAVLGLELEAPLRAYGAHGEDALMFARIRKDG